MSYLIAIICFLFVFLIYKFDRKLYNPYIFFNLWWGSTILISGMGLFGINVPTINTYFIMLIAIASFNLSVFLKFNIGLEKSMSLNEKCSYNENKAINYIVKLHIIIILYLVKRSISVLQMLLSGMDYGTIRYEFFYADNITSKYDQLINNWFVVPIITFSIILLSLMIIEKSYSKFMLITTLLCVGLYSFSSGGRSLLLISGLSIVISWIMNSERSKIGFIGKVKIRVSIFALIGSMLLITILRSDATGNPIKDTLKTVVLYFTAPYIYFENVFDMIRQERVVLFGGAFFGGIVDIFILLSRYLGLDINQISSYIGKYNQMYISVGGNSFYNAFPTMLYTFFYDFGYLGIILESFLFGLLAKYFYWKMRRLNNIAYKGMYIMVAIMIYESTMRWVGTSATPWIVILLFFAFNKISKVKKK
ncbi:O-antigen polymerase [Paenibacillus sp. FSL K6-3166]|uniref:O-antigen polymerase n=1 Tax=unclassified Paenibacillus TaxID=185978 RepID=UPI000BA142D4|nr:O-antigen polymerase [Paenibacillus sp. VTT E-133291]OZQ83599.1 hypothetical protein CA598_24250 [Paenibacillus sp. VTT E-133291]